MRKVFLEKCGRFSLKNTEGRCSLSKQKVRQKVGRGSNSNNIHFTFTISKSPGGAYSFRV
jgi:hypothetical protein